MGLTKGTHTHTHCHTTKTVQLPSFDSLLCFGFFILGGLSLSEELDEVELKDRLLLHLLPLSSKVGLI